MRHYLWASERVSLDNVLYIINDMKNISASTHVNLFDYVLWAVIANSFQIASSIVAFHDQI